MPTSDRGLSGYRVYRNHQPHADIGGGGSTYFREHISQADTIVYQVAALYGSVESALCDSVLVIVSPVDISDAHSPSVPVLSISPNPFSRHTQISYYLPKRVKLELTVYNLRGQKVRTLENEIKNSGEYILEWDGRDNEGDSISSGVYLLRMDTEGFTRKIFKMMLMK